MIYFNANYALGFYLDFIHGATPWTSKNPGDTFGSLIRNVLFYRRYWSACRYSSLATVWQPINARLFIDSFYAAVYRYLYLLTVSILLAEGERTLPENELFDGANMRRCLHNAVTLKI
jgi:hypothetical protein